MNGKTDELRLNCGGVNRRPYDVVLRYEYGTMTAAKLDGMGLEVDFKTYPGMAHSACQEEFQHLANFITTRLKL